MTEVEFDAADGTPLEGDLVHPDVPNGGVVVLCHPHPRHGGSMDSWMMPVLQRALVEDGWVGLRFNFRGVGEMTADAGDGELVDLAGAVDRVLREAGSPAPLLLAGWSFGAHVALRYALDDERVSGWAGIGLVYRAREVELPEIDLTRVSRWRAPKLFVHGSNDELTTIEAVQELVDRAAEPKRLRVIEGGDHFLAAHGDVLIQEVQSFGRELLGDG